MTETLGKVRQGLDIQVLWIGARHESIAKVHDPSA